MGEDTVNKFYATANIRDIRGKLSIELYTSGGDPICMLPFQLDEVWWRGKEFFGNNIHGNEIQTPTFHSPQGRNLR